MSHYLESTYQLRSTPFPLPQPTPTNMATPKKNAQKTPSASPKGSHTDKIGPVLETTEIPPTQRGDSPYRKAVNELEPGQNRVFPRAARNCVVKYAKQAKFEYQCRTSPEGQTFTFYRTA